MRKKLTNLLRLAELKDEEITIYLLLLKLQKATIPQLTEMSGLNIMMVYRTIQRLIERELICSKSLNEKQDVYKPLSLKSLIKKINAQQKKLRHLEESLRGVDPFLPYIDIQNEESESIQVKEGLDAFREEYLKLPHLCGEEMLPLGNVDNMWEVAGISYDCPEERNFIHKRLKDGVYARMMIKPGEVGNNLQSHDSFEKRTTRLQNNLPITTNFLVITDNQSTLFVSDKENPRVIVIKQPELLKMQKDQFKTLWVTGE